MKSVPLLSQHLVLLLNSILAYAIPDIPNNLKTQLLREKQLEREIEFQFDNGRRAATGKEQPFQTQVTCE